MSNPKTDTGEECTLRDFGRPSDLGIQMTNPVTHGTRRLDNTNFTPHDFLDSADWEKAKMKWYKPTDRIQGRLKRLTLKTIQAIVDYLQNYRIFK